MARNFQYAPLQLGKRQRAFLHRYLETGDPGLAAVDSGMVRKGTNPHDAALAGAELLRELQPQLLTLMDAHGLSDRVLLKAILEGLSATIVRVSVHRGKKHEDGSKDPDHVETFDTGLPNWPVRKFYVRMAAEMKALVDPKERAAAEQANTARVTSLANAHRESLANKSDAELDAIHRDEILRRQGVRRAVS